MPSERDLALAAGVTRQSRHAVRRVGSRRNGRSTLSTETGREHSDMVDVDDGRSPHEIERVIERHIIVGVEGRRQPLSVDVHHEAPVGAGGLSRDGHHVPVEVAEH